MLEGALEVILANARDAQGDKARKTEVIDAEGLAALLRPGLLKPSFMPPLPIRELRDLPRYRESLVREHPARANRIQQLSERAHLKLGQVASAALGGRGKLRRRVLAAGETGAAQRRHLAQRPLPRKPPQLEQALAGRVTPAQRWILGQLLDPYDHVEAALQSVTARIRQEVETRAAPFVPEAVPLLDTIPGVGETVAPILVAESGVGLARFPTAHHLASWAGGCPGNNESAGTRKSGKTTNGSRSLRAALGQAAGAGRHQTGTALAAQYKGVVNRRGKKKARVAVGHRMLVSASHVLQPRTPSQALGREDVARRTVDKQRNRLIRQLESLGGKVTVEESTEAA